MSDYTPTTEVIRHALAFPRERLGEPRPIKPEAFDRWLVQVQADAWDEGHRACQRDWEFAYDLITPDEEREPWTNPYREADHEDH